MKRVLIVGGGISGLTLAAALGQSGIAAQIVEIKSESVVLGVGIIQPGNALRALGSIGVLDECLDAGFPTDEYRYYDGEGRALAQLRLLRIADPARPAINALPRPALHRILSRAAERAGATMHLNCSVTAIEEREHGVEATFSDGSKDTFDMIVGADGIRSAVRRLLFGTEHEPQFTGHGVWRYTTRRPPELTYHALFLGVSLKAGLIPLSRSEMYLLMVTNEPGNPRKPQDELKPMLAAHLAAFGGLVADAAAGLAASDDLIYVPIEEVILAPPWSRGRTVLIGDASHASGPHIAQGAAMAIEDSIVLAEMARTATSVPDMLHAFASRRYPRCKLVQDVSRAVGAEGNLDDPQACRERNERIRQQFATPQPRPHERALAEAI